MNLAQQPPQPERRHHADCRDEIEYAVVARALSRLHEDHPVRALVDKLGTEGQELIELPASIACGEVAQ